MNAPVPNDLEAYWMGFTPNRAFKKKPRMFVAADGMYYTTHDGRQVMDGIAGLWCCNAGHNQPRIVKAVQKQVAELDYSPGFQMGHPKAFELANRLKSIMPGDLNHVFFVNSGSESVETALKIAIAYHRARGEGHRVRLIGREKGYHGVNFGGMSVGGMPANRKMFGALVTGVDHLRHTHGLEENLFTRGQPEHGVEFADDLERLCDLHDPSTIAAVIVEPIAGSAGVIMPPKGYLERLRAITKKHGILLILDEVITGFGRMGKPFASNYFDLDADIVCTAKAIANGVIPMGAVFAHDHVYDAFMQGPEELIELFHGYTYSANPVACAAALATLDTYEQDGLFYKGTELWSYWEDAVHSLRGLPHVTDIRNMGMIGAVELESIPGHITKRATEAFLKAYGKGLLIRTTGDIIAFSPPLIIEKPHIDFMFETMHDVLKSIE
ncbi:MAG: aspartate aminotransferase family protein [Robiginitomaculum sp.]|nr:aspartate aminotransferase family protein [Robiginitomaculum sp.]